MIFRPRAAFRGENMVSWCIIYCTDNVANRERDDSESQSPIHLEEDVPNFVNKLYG
jgi:hypothetical protein